MVDDPTWPGLAQGLLVLGMLWWAWTGYAWLTSVVDPEEGAVRLVIFGAMAALLIVSLCVPEAFGDLALVFALAYGAVRVAQIGLFMLASPEDDALRHSVLGLAASTAVAVVAAGRRVPLRRPRPGRDLGAGPRPRHGRALLLRLRGLETGARALRRAPRADRDHRPRRVDRRDRRRRRRRARPRHRRRRRARRRPDRGDVVDLLRRGRDRLRAAPGRAPSRAGPERDGPRLLLLPAPADGRRDRSSSPSA